MNPVNDRQRSEALDEYEAAWAAYRDISNAVAAGFSLALDGHPNPSREQLTEREQASIRLKSAEAEITRLSDPLRGPA